MLGAEWANLDRGCPGKDNAHICALSQSDAAEVLNVSRRSIQSATEVLTKASPKIVEAVKEGKIAVSLAAKVADLPARTQNAIAKAEKPKKAAWEAIREQTPQSAERKTGPKSETARGNIYDDCDRFTSLFAELAPNWETDAERELMRKLFRQFADTI